LWCVNSRKLDAVPLGVDSAGEQPCRFAKRLPMGTA